MKVSLLVPIYGVEKYIARCAKSLFEQTYEDIEFIFVNDYTQDNSMNILKGIIEKYPHRKNQIKIINHSQNKGLAGARNTALDNASGDYIWNIDSDDTVLENSVELLVNEVTRTKSDIVIFDIKHILPNEKSYIEKSKGKLGQFRHYGDILERRTPVYLVAHFVKREIAFRKDARPMEGINYGEDFLVTPRISLYAKSISYIPMPLYEYHHDNSQSYTNNVALNSINNLKSAFEILREFFQDKLPKEESAELISRGEIMNKLTLLLICKSEDFNYVMSLYPHVFSKDYHFLKLHHKILWFFITRNNYLPIKLYRKIRKLI